MITQEMLLGFMREDAYKPMTYQELEQHFGIEDADVFREFMDMLNTLEENGEVVLTRAQRYGVPERMDLLRGRLQTHAKGFGFLIPEDRTQSDLYINASDMLSAMNGDIVLGRVASRRSSNGRTEGEVVRIIKRAVTQIVGTYQDEESFGFVLPDDKRITRDIFIPAGRAGGAINGQKVVVRIISYPDGRAAAQGEVIEVLGYNSDPGVDILSIIRKHQLPESFPDEVMAEAEQAPDKITEEEITSQGRRDLRDKIIVTIDGEDAKDLDDAVNVEILPNGNYMLGVHIADVGYYVPEGSALDQEAYNRGSSVYLVDRVIPMLPPRLSNGICSLNPRVDRLTLSCEMEFDASMNVVRYDIFKSVIKTVERMTYKSVRLILEDEDPELMERYSDLIETFRTMRDLSLKLNARRMKRGAVDFDFEEAKVLLDDQGKAIDIVTRERSVAERLIEEFMLAANETVAEHFSKAKVPFLYRIHEDPDQERLELFAAFAANLGHQVKGTRGGSIQPKELQALLEDVQDTPEQKAISTLLLRSMKQAKYDSVNLGHFGLAAEYYTHFTSPIRRYPDLVIHRVIGEMADNGGKLTKQREEQLAMRMSDYAQQSSIRERVAVDAERDTAQLKKAEYMMDKVGEVFDGVIASVTSFGLFIELENTIEGLIHISNLTDDYYHYDESRLTLIGERTSRTFRIGDEVEIRVAKVSMEEHTIDFELVDMKKSNFRGGGGRRRDGGGSGDSSKRGPRGDKTGKEKFGKDKGKGKKDKKKGKKKQDVFRPNGGAATVPAAGGDSSASPSDGGKRKKRKRKGGSGGENPSRKGKPGDPAAIADSSSPQAGGEDSGRKRKGKRGDGWAFGGVAAEGKSGADAVAPSGEAGKSPRKRKGGGIQIEAGNGGADAYNGSPGAAGGRKRRSSRGGGGNGEGTAGGAQSASNNSGGADNSREPGKGKFSFGSGTGGYGGETASFSRNDRSGGSKGGRSGGGRPKKDRS
ncbi:ribonuclease R [Saccharibacillus sp. JS10]|uniref:ribonuclease R n=1 Tax=Saccharibacillus sp. JS10 TaxID=2950552 RepID=UPI00210957D5|nr:ribonuclease R [Saccharibacillus sp. JS10]MCQ4087697.1 ribonuclease R [Saccharibacillus sp. JS10]